MLVLFIFGTKIVLREEHAYYTSHCHRMFKIRVGDEQGRQSVNVWPHVYVDWSAIYMKVVQYRRIQREGLVAKVGMKAVEM